MSEFDLVIRSGHVVDGTGAPGRTADLAVKDGRVVEVGTVGGRGEREVDADGAVVLPGFVDIHTHYDGQASWESTLQPSSWHGVTTVVMGNCGVGFAPVREPDHSRLVELMEGVEDIPGTAMHEGLAWNWESFPEFMSVIAARPHDLDFATQVPHAALRVYAMGERAVAGGQADADDIALMSRLAAEAIEAGAVGFSTSRTINHKSIDGELTPSYDSGEDELRAISAAIGRTGKGVLQAVCDFDNMAEDLRVFRSMVEVSGRPMSVALTQNRRFPDRYRDVLDEITKLNEQGHPFYAQVAPRGIGILMGLQCTLHAFMMNPVFRAELAALPVRQQAALMRQPGMKERILAAQTDEKNPNLIGGLRIDRWDAIYELTDPPNYEPPAEASIAALATAAGRDPLDLVYDILAAGDGDNMILHLFTNYAYGNLDSVREMLVHPYALPGLSDGGAHVGTICDASVPSFLLQYWARDRPGDPLDLSFVVRRQSRDTARAVGILDRGELVPGQKADVNVVDLDAVRLRRPEIHYDLPAGGRRLLQRVDGFRHTFVSGIETYRDGEATGALPGRLVRV